MKKFTILLLSLILMTSLITGCTSVNNPNTPESADVQKSDSAPLPGPDTSTPAPTPITQTMSPVVPTQTVAPTKIPSSGISIAIFSAEVDISDLAIQGFKKAASDFGYTTQILGDGAMSDNKIMSTVKNTIDSGTDLFVFPGFKYREIVENLQSAYPDTHFVLIDSDETFNDNVLTIQFAEEQAGFVAGYAVAAELKTANFGFIGGMEIESVQQFNWGFQQGLISANNRLGTNVEISPENVIYAGTFEDWALGKSIAAQLYDNGVNCIFPAAGLLGHGVIMEAISRTSEGNLAWILGVDYDQYEMGFYRENYSVILTSAMKRYDGAAYYAVKEYYNGTLMGGTSITLTINDNAVGIPPINLALTEDTLAKVNTLINDFKHGIIEIKPDSSGLIP